PPGKGLVSSASVAIAVVKSLFNYAEQTYTEEESLQLANVAEVFAHGAPSGIDSLTITSEYPVWYEREHSVGYIKPSCDFYFIVADTGRMADTRTAIESVAERLMSGPKSFQATTEKLANRTHHTKDTID